MKTTMRNQRRILLFAALLFLTGGVLAYYQWLYQPEVINRGYVAPLTRFTKHRQVVSSVRFAAGDSMMVSAGTDSTVRVWNAITGAVARQWKQPSGIAYMDLSADGRYVVTGDYDAKVRLWRLGDGVLLREFSGHTGTVWHVAFNKDASLVASSGDDAVIRIWETASGRLYRQLKGHQRIVWTVKFSPDGTQLASGSFDGSWKLWRLRDGALLWDNREHTEAVVDLAFSHNGKCIATASDDKTARIWDLQRRHVQRVLAMPEHVQAVAFSPDDRRLLTGGRDKTMIGELLQNFAGNSYGNPGVSARLWDAETGTLLHCFTGHGNDVTDVAYSAGGKMVATASADGTVGVWRVVK